MWCAGQGTERLLLLPTVGWAAPPITEKRPRKAGGPGKVQETHGLPGPGRPPSICSADLHIFTENTLIQMLGCR